MKRTFDFGKIDYLNRGRKTDRVIVEIKYENNVFTAHGIIENPYEDDFYAAGQCFDTIKECINDNQTFNEIYRLWKLYHLNNMHPECEHQHAAGWHELARKEVKLYHWRMTVENLKKQQAAEKAALTALRCGETFTPTDEQKFFAALSYSLTTHTELLPDNIAEYYEPKKPLYSGDEKHVEVKTLGLLHENEHPDGLLEKPCPVCGYKYGSAWKYFPIPAEDEKIICNLIEKGEI